MSLHWNLNSSTLLSLTPQFNNNTVCFGHSGLSSEVQKGGLTAVETCNLKSKVIAVWGSEALCCHGSFRAATKKGNGNTVKYIEID